MTLLVTTGPWHVVTCLSYQKIISLYNNFFNLFFFPPTSLILAFQGTKVKAIKGLWHQPWWNVFTVCLELPLNVLPHLSTATLSSTALHSLTPMAFLDQGGMYVQAPNFIQDLFKQVISWGFSKLIMIWKKSKFINFSQHFISHFQIN